MPTLRKALPWLLLVLAIPVALLGLDASVDQACDQIPEAFSRGVTTEQSDALTFLATQCEVTRNATGATIEKTSVNWSGMVAAVTLLAGAWLLGATLGGTIERRRGIIGIAIAVGLMLLALVAFFL